MAVIFFAGGCVRGGFGASAPSDSAAESDLAKDASSDELGQLDSDTAPAGPRWPGYGSSTTEGVSGSFEAHNLRLAIDSAGTVYAAWADDSTGEYEVYLKRWNGEAWQGIGGSDALGGVSQTPDRESRLGGIAIDNASGPLVTWVERRSTAAPAAIYLRHFAAGQWEPLGSSDSGQGFGDGENVFWPAIAIDSASRPVVVWERFHSSGRWVIYAERWNGGTWEGFDGSNIDTGLSGGEVDATLADVAAGPGGALHVTWRQKEPAPGVFHRAFDGMAWQVLAGEAGGRISPPSEPDAGWASVAVQDGQPVVVWKAAAGLRVRRHDGQRWTPLGADGALHQGLANPGYADLIVDSAGRIVVAFSAADSVGFNIHLRSWTGTNWQPLAGSPPEGGMSNSAGPSEWPCLASSTAGMVVGWEEVLPNGRRAFFVAQQPK